MKRTNPFLDYATMHLDAISTYTASDILLSVHSDVSYLSKPKARSFTGGNLFLSGDTINTTNNEAVLKISQIIKILMALVAEVELGELFINVQEAHPQQEALEEPPPPPIPKHKCI